MIDHKWRLGETMNLQDGIFDCITFQQIVDAVYHSSPVRDEAAVRKAAHEILQERQTDFWYLINNNIDKLVEASNPDLRAPLKNAPGWDSERLQRLAYEVYDYLRIHEMWIDICIYYDGKRMCTDSVVDGKHVFRYNEEPFIEENKDPRDYFDYVAEEHVLSMSFEGPFYDAMNYEGGAIIDGFQKLFDRYGLYYEQGDAWNISLYGG